MTLRLITSLKVRRFLFASVLVASFVLIFSVSAQAENRASLVNLRGGNLKVCFYNQGDKLMSVPLRLSWGCQNISRGQRARWKGSTRGFRVQVFHPGTIDSPGLCASYLEFPKDVPSPWNLAILSPPHVPPGSAETVKGNLCRITGEFASRVVFRNSSNVRITQLQLYNADDFARTVALAGPEFTPGTSKDISWPITIPNFYVKIGYVNLGRCSGVAECDKYVAEQVDRHSFDSCEGKIHALQATPKRGVFLVEFSGAVGGVSPTPCNLKYLDPSEL